MTKQALTYTTWREAFDAVYEIAQATKTQNLDQWFLVKVMKSDCDDYAWITGNGGFSPVPISDPDHPDFDKSRKIDEPRTPQRGDRIEYRGRRGTVGKFVNGHGIQDCWIIQMDDGGAMWLTPDLWTWLDQRDDIEMDALQLEEVYDDLETEKRNRAIALDEAKRCVRSLNSKLEAL